MRVRLLFNTDLNAIKQVFEKKGVAFNPQSILNHVVYMFEIEDCSRITTHQLVRHRMASYDQESQRFSSASRESYVTPPTIHANQAALKVYDDYLRQGYKAFEELLSLGIPKEDARYLLPHAIKTKLVMTLTARSLMHIVWQRTAVQAQWEIRELVREMHSLASSVTPELWTVIMEK